MTEEITYANLKFQDSSKTENIQELDKLRKKAPAPSRTWRQIALALTLLCLLLLIGLGVLAGMFYTTLKIERGKLDGLQNVQEELEKNISLQLMSNTNSSRKVRDLSNTLQTLATKLCRELYAKEPDHRCKPCPKRWIWYKESCYYLSDNSQTWKNSETDCSSRNASLLKIENKSTLEFINSYNLYDYWLGVPPQKYNKGYQKVDQISTSVWFRSNLNDLDMIYCGYIHGKYVYYGACDQTNKVSCEKRANAVEVESVLSSGVPGGRL